MSVGSGECYSLTLLECEEAAGEGAVASWKRGRDPGETDHQGDRYNIEISIRDSVVLWKL